MTRDYAKRCGTCRHNTWQNDLVGDCQVFEKDVYHHSVHPCARWGITSYRTRHDLPKVREENMAYAAVCWYGGMTQRQVARVFGRESGSPISIWISEFLVRYLPGQQLDRVYGDDRRRLIPEAITNFRKARGDIQAGFAPVLDLQPPPA
jgi:hypothetical protein